MKKLLICIIMLMSVNTLAAKTTVSTNVHTDVNDELTLGALGISHKNTYDPEDNFMELRPYARYQITKDISVRYTVTGGRAYMDDQAVLGHSISFYIEF